MATDFLFQAGPHGEDELIVLKFSGTEAMSQPFVYDLTLGAQDLVVDFEEMVGADAVLKFATPEGERFVHGIVSRWAETGAAKHWTNYEATIVPRLWTLSLKRDSRIFQSQTTQDIVKAVLTGGGLASDQFKFSLQGSYKPRTYCVQYRETDLDFVSRLLEEEGMFYFFEQTEDGHVMVIADSNDGCVPLPGNDVLTFREGDPGMQGGEQVHHFRYGRSLRTGKVVLRDYDFKKPSLDQEVTEKDAGDKEATFLTADFPGEYPEPSMGARIAKVRLEEQRAERYQGLGETDCRRLSPGWRFTLEEHPTEGLDQEYLVVGTRHRGTQPQGGFGGPGGPRTTVYVCGFECTPSKIAYRPPRVTPRPRLDGVQTAMVVGPKGEEIHCDEFGRVKVKFPWDRAGAKDDKASCWIRVSQQWGGAGWGAMYIPRIGQEVVVEFLEGDPDRPLITGRLYNGASPVPYELPHQKIMSTMQSATTPGGGSSNEVRLKDTSGNEELFVNASKDMNTVVLNNGTQKVKILETIAVTGNVDRTVDKDETIAVDRNREELVKTDESITVKGDDSEEVDGTKSRSIGSVRLWLIKGDSTLNAGPEHRHTVSTLRLDLVKGDSKRDIEGRQEERAGIGTAHLVKGDHKEEGDDEIKIQTGGMIMKKSKAEIEREAKEAVIVAAPFIKLQAPDIEIKADGDALNLVVGGSALVLKSSEGSMTASSITIDVSGEAKGSGTPSPWN
jgi:type VI secretion system secreted protein VgrG